MPVADQQGDRNGSDDNDGNPLIGATASGDGTDMTDLTYSVEEEGYLRIRYSDNDPPRRANPNDVANQTAHIFSEFMWERYSNDLDGQQLPENTPSFPDLHRSRPQPFSTEAQIGRQLASIGDDIDKRYSPQISQMIEHLKVDQNNAYETFCRVAESLFRDRHINWGRIIALFLFGYRIAIEKIKRGVHDFVTNVISWIADFVKDKICNWIAEQGGWGVVRRLGPESISSRDLGFFFLIAGCLALSAYYFGRRN